MSFKYKLGFIGCGNMAKAIIGGVIGSNRIASSEIIASRKSGLGVPELQGVTITDDNSVVASNSEILFLAIKPQVFNEIGAEILSHSNAKYVISMMAGIASSTIESMIHNGATVIRIMPNTPCKIGYGVTAMQNVKINACDKEYIMDILRNMGEVVLVDEDDFDAVVAVSGSGPAYAFMFLRALIDGGIAHGLDKDTSKKLAIGMLIGASKLAETENNIDEMIDAVCSKGGTTIEAVNYYKEKGLEDIVKRGMDKCYNRSKELSGK